MKPAFGQDDIAHDLGPRQLLSRYTGIRQINTFQGRACQFHVSEIGVGEIHEPPVSAAQARVQPPGVKSCKLN